jgi:4'-phosphopantetheinyl transferase
MPSGPDPHEVHIWFLPTAAADAECVEQARRSLSASERAQADRFHFAEDRRDYTLAHDLLRRCLSRYDNLEPAAWKFQSEAGGKPFLPDHPALSFNLSHTRGLVACAVARSLQIGIDVEIADRVIDAAAIAERFFSPTERAPLARLRDPAHRLRFLELWTLKESFIKAVGVGLAQPLDSMSFRLDAGAAIVFEPPPDFTASEWHFALFEAPGSARMAAGVRAPARPRFIARQAGPAEPGSDAHELPASRTTSD